MLEIIKTHSCGIKKLLSFKLNLIDIFYTFEELFHCSILFYKKSDIIQEIVTPTIRLRLLSNMLIHYSYLENAEIDIEAHKINHLALKNIAVLPNHALLIDAIEFVDITPSARKFIRSLESEAPILARAVVTDSLANKMLIRFYNSVHKPLYPIKTFSTYSEASIWLLSLQLSTKKT